MNRLTVEQAKDLTAMLWGAPVSTADAKGLVIAVALLDYLRSTGREPIDPAKRRRMKEEWELPPHIEALIEELHKQP